MYIRDKFSHENGISIFGREINLWTSSVISEIEHHETQSGDKTDKTSVNAPASANKEGQSVQESSGSTPSVSESGTTSPGQQVFTISREEGLRQLGKVFDEVSMKCLHSHYKCRERCELSAADTLSCTKGKYTKKFCHQWISMNSSFDSTTGLYWLAYQENKGMFCMLCRKHGAVAKNGSTTWNMEPSTKLRSDAIRDHMSSELHKVSVKKEMNQRVSQFPKQIDQREAVNIQVIEKAFHTVYWLAKQEVANEKFESLLTFVEKIGVDDMKFFQHRSRSSTREMFLTLGRVIKSALLQRLEKAKAFGLLTDEVTDVAVMQHLVTFVKYVNVETSEATTDFLSAEYIAWLPSVTRWMHFEELRPKPIYYLNLGNNLHKQPNKDGQQLPSS